MKIVFYSIVLNHHQAYVADEFYNMLGDEYCFVELIRCLDMKGATEDYSKRPYLLKAWESVESYRRAMTLAREADVCVFAGYEALIFEKERLKLNKLSFDMGERMLKRGIFNLLSPRILKLFLAYHVNRWKNKPLYKLSCSAYACVDSYKLGMFKSKHYKWGYFTNVDSDFEVGVLQKGVSTIKKTHSLMWCARFLKLKHPELPIKMASRLKIKGYNFVLDMYGSGVELEKMKQLAKSLDVEDVVNFKGDRPNNEILKAMRQHEIFLFTSDKNEGWGAVTNESMSNGCVIVASDAIGSVPFLVKDRWNGCIFKSCDLDSLYSMVVWLLDNSIERKQLAINAYQTMRDVWSPKRAAENFLQLVDELQSGKDSMIKDGPCSKAETI
ncbi:glycosyltransferase [Bacteroides acidifaciens]|uniref:glycosyltransferase n=1 Tax=Bacteroides acidifaciens TaxID=85831 RepID=UPI003014B0AC